MNVKAVKYFLSVCEKRNFTKAATALGIAQPSLSTAIQRLEREIGGPLFYRNAHDVGLTELGRNLRPIFRAIVRYADRAASKARAWVADPPKNRAEKVDLDFSPKGAIFRKAVLRERSETGV